MQKALVTAATQVHGRVTRDRL